MPLTSTNAPGIWVAYTPTIAQGAGTPDIAKTVTIARYQTMGDLVTVHVRLLLTGAGTSGQIITVTLPFLPVWNGGGFSEHFGTGLAWIRDSGTADYRATCNVQAVGNVHFRAMHLTSTSTIGVNPAFALASGDIISFGVTYQKKVAS